MAWPRAPGANTAGASGAPLTPSWRWHSTHRDGQRLRRRYGKLRSHLFTFLDHPELPADNNGSDRGLRPTATYRKVTGGFRSDWGADLFAGVRSIIGTAARRGVGAYQAIQQTLRGRVTIYPG